VRNYKRKTPRRGSRDKRMATVARLHADGISNREIGRLLAVSEGTVRNDLARWRQERPNNTIAVYENRLEQAEISYKAVRRAYDEVRPLLVEESLTTADVAPQVIENRQKRAAGGES